jgi:acetyl esterase/lipase
VGIVALLPLDGSAQSQVDRNVVIGMHSGLGLLMDVHHPDHPNGLGVILVAGSGWQRPMTYDAEPLSEGPFVDAVSTPLVSAGFTVFALNHRATPRFQFPAPLEDLQRAVRFVRFHASRFGIDPD